MSVYPEGAEVRREAVLSEDGQYRYLLSREWGSGAAVWFIMLNPSTADALKDDPTIRRCVGFARANGFEALRVMNLYAYRATQPADLWRASDPVGPENDLRLRSLLAWAADYSGTVVAAWGAHAKPERVREVIAMPGSTYLHCLGRTKHGAPRHPLYLPADAVLRPILDGAA